MGCSDSPHHLLPRCSLGAAACCLLFMLTRAILMLAVVLAADALGSGAANGGTPRTPNLDQLSREGVRFGNAYTSTPTCTPARAAILTGQSPWSHGMLGAGDIAHKYPFEMPVALAALGYTTISIGKDHFGWDVAANHSPPVDPVFDAGNTGSGQLHGYQRTSLSDGGVKTDDYHQWFSRELPGETPGTRGALASSVLSDYLYSGVYRCSRFG